MSAADRILCEGMVDEARDTVHTVMAAGAQHPGGLAIGALMTTSYTSGFEAGLSLGLARPAVGARMLEAIDVAILQGNPEAVGTERQAVLERYSELVRRTIS